jgi:peptidyl-prolyl cis-trans isomerase D
MKHSFSDFFTKKWATRAGLCVLLGAFAVTGVVTGINKASRDGGTAVLNVGRVTITRDDYDRLYNNELNYAQRATGGTVSAADLDRMGLRANVMRGLESQALTLNYAHDLDLRVSDGVLHDAVRSNPAFLDDGGAFNPERFFSALRSNGFTESSYLQRVREAIVQNNLASFVSEQEFPLNKMAEVLHKYRLQGRLVDLVRFELDPKALKKDFTADEIVAYYERNKQAYYSGEKRKVRYLALSSKDVAVQQEISAEELQKALDARTAAEGSVERRDITNAVFASYSAASKFYEAAKGRTGDAFITEARTATKSISTVKALARDGAPTDFGDAVFALQAGAVSQPISTPFGWHVVQVNKVYSRTIDDLREEVRHAMIEERNLEALYGLIAGMEDEHKAGKSFADIAREHKLQLHETGYFAVKDNEHIEGDYPDSAPFFLAKAAMVAEEGKPDLIYDQIGGKYIFFEVTDRQQSSLMPLDSVRKSIESEMLREHGMAKLREKADKTKASLMKIANCYDSEAPRVTNKSGGKYQKGRTVYRASVVRRMDLAVDGDYPPELLDQVFALTKIGDATVVVRDGENAVVFAVFRGVREADPNSEHYLQAIKAELSNYYKDSLYRGMTEHLRGRYKVKVYSENIA